MPIGISAVVKGFIHIVWRHVNGAPDFKTAAVQMTVIYLISGLFDRLFIDWYWVGKTKAWIIPGTEDMMA
jgi:hypothetical protein